MPDRIKNRPTAFGCDLGISSWVEERTKDKIYEGIKKIIPDNETKLLEDLTIFVENIVNDELQKAMDSLQSRMQSNAFK